MIVANLVPVSGASGTGNLVEDPYAELSQFDTVFVIDDSGSMFGESWQQVKVALKVIAPICTEQDEDGIDIYFVNSEAEGKGVKTEKGVDEIFKTVKPLGPTPTGARLSHIIDPYLTALEKGDKRKPLNIIVITDGAASDRDFLKEYIISTARRLDNLKADPWQLGIQFFQVGHDEEATAALKELDDDLEETKKTRDIVDTTPLTNNGDLTGELILKVLLGAVKRRLDGKKKASTT